MALALLILRMKATTTPITKKKILLPPIMMSTGALMFIFPYFRVPWPQVLEAFLIGLFFSIFLIITTKFEIRDEKIYVKYSKAFGVIIILLLIIRTALKAILSQTIDIGETGGMFWIIAFGMIMPWRLAMYIRYVKIAKKVYTDSTSKSLTP